jgi:stearoyl-CoA desaturase (delta-9 desaturase)
MNRNLALITAHHIALVLGILFYGFNIWVAIVVFFASMLWAKFVGSDIMHFYFAHGKYKDNIKSYFYTLLTLCTALGSPISFSASHRQHHKFVDTEKDPHSPEHIGWKRVYFLDWEPQNINPRLIADFARSKFQKWVHKHWFELHLIIVATLAAFDPRLVCFVLSPFVMYSFHNASAVNVLAHLGGESKNVPLMKIINWWGWDHGDHHDYKPSK